jgi:hypothetical protein
VAELLGLEGVEFPCAAGDKDATRSCVDTVSDVAAEQIEVDLAPLGERGDREEQNSVKDGARGVLQNDSLSVLAVSLV